MSDSRFPHTYSAVLVELAQRLEEAPPGRVQIVIGPRQVGKTHLLRTLEERHPDRTILAAGDSAAAALSGWWEAQWREAEALAKKRRRALLIVDEIQHLPDWNRRLKAEFDRVVRLGVPLHVVVSGSSSLLLGQGSRESMAGRFEVLRLLHWPPSELARHFKITAERAVEVTVTQGSYPGTVALLGQTERLCAYVRDAIIEPAIGRDIMALEPVRKPGLLRQLFAIAAGHPAEIVSLKKLRGQLSDAGALETIAHYLHVLERAYLVAGVEKVTSSTVRRRAAPPKLAVLNQGIVTALADLPARRTRPEPTVWGRWIENACIALAWNAGQRVWYWRQEPHEVDLVTSGSWGEWAVEVKTGRVSALDLAGLLAFTARRRSFRPLLVCESGQERSATTVGISAITWQQFLLNGPPV